MKSKILSFLNSCLNEFAEEQGFVIPEGFVHSLENTKAKEHGDIASNIALKLAPVTRRKPLEIAESFRMTLDRNLRANPDISAGISRFEVKPPGFINFYLSEKSMTSILVRIMGENLEYGRSEFGEGKKIVLEYVSANPTGPLTIAHGRQACIGDTLARILEKTGHRVYREYYLNDAGRQINILGLSTWLRYREILGEKIVFPEEGYQGAYIRDIAKEVLEKEGERFLRVPEAEAIPFFSAFAAEDILATIEEDFKSIRVTFDHYFSEKKLRDGGEIEKILEILRSKGLIYEEEGALWFRSTEFGDDKNRVLRKSTGDYTYLAPDIAYHATKIARGFKKMINLWGPDHHGYIPRMKAAMQALSGNADILKVLIVQLTTLFRDGQPVRMSTRAGEFVTLKELMDEVGADATRFFFLMRRVESLLDFDLDLAKKKSDENPVFYVQYAHARVSSILAFANIPVASDAELGLIKEDSELELVKTLALFPELLIQAGESLEPYRIVDYLRDVAGAFHRFYAQCRVVSDDRKLTEARLFLVDCARIVLHNGLEVLGVSSPEKM